MLFIISVMYILRVRFVSGNVAVISFECKSSRENYISYLFYCYSDLIRDIEEIII